MRLYLQNDPGKYLNKWKKALTETYKEDSFLEIITQLILRSDTNHRSSQGG